MHVLFKQSLLPVVSEYDGSKGGSITQGCGVANFQAVARTS